MDQGALTESGKLLSCMLMLVGGSSGSTAGGIKTVTVALLLLAVLAAFRGKNRVVVWGWEIPARQVVSALSVAMMMLALAVLGGVVLAGSNGLPLLDCLYESCSAMGTVGLTTGITTQLDRLSQIWIICYMFFGRVGIMTISLAFMLRNGAESRIGYPETQVMIG